MTQLPGDPPYKRPRLPLSTSSLASRTLASNPKHLDPGGSMWVRPVEWAPRSNCGFCRQTKKVEPFWSVQADKRRVHPLSPIMGFKDASKEVNLMLRAPAGTSGSLQNRLPGRALLQQLVKIPRIKRAEHGKLLGIARPKVEFRIINFLLLAFSPFSLVLLDLSCSIAGTSLCDVDL